MDWGVNIAHTSHMGLTNCQARKVNIKCQELVENMLFHLYNSDCEVFDNHFEKVSLHPIPK